MDLAYDPEDEAAFEALLRAVISQFELTPGGSGLGWVVEQLLVFKRDYLGGDLAHWTPADFSELFYEIYPRKVILEPGDEQVVLDATAAFLHFLEAEGALTGSSADRLAALLEVAAAPFRIAMADERRWGPGKRVFASAAAAGVELDDQRQMDAYLRRYNAMMDAGAGGLRPARLAMPSLPPVVLAPVAELLAAAEQSTLLRWARLLIDHVGAGLPLTDKGNLKLADGKALVVALGTRDRVDEVIGEQTFRTQSSQELTDVDWTFRLVLSAGFLAQDGRRVVPAEAAGMPVTDPLDAVFELWHAMIEDVGAMQHRWARDTYGFGWYAEDIDARALSWQLQIYGLDAGLDLADTTAELWDDLVEDAELYDLPPAKLEHHRAMVARGLLDSFRRLEQLGVVHLSDVEDAAEGHVSGTVRLSPLGTWVVQRFAARSRSAPVVGELADLEADELLAQVVDRAEDVARLEVRHWVDQRGDHGPARLVEALAGASQAARGVAFTVLLNLGPAAIEAVEPLRLDAELAPFRTVLRVDARVAEEAEMVAAGPHEWVLLLGTVLDLRGHHAVAVWAAPAAGATGLVPMIEAAWRVRLPQTGDVLNALSSTASDKAVAKAARKAAYKFHSAR